MITTLLLGSLSLSLLHAIIPNHWLPILTIARQQNWSERETLRVTLIAGIAHVVSTILIGLLLGYIGMQFKEKVATFSELVAPIILIALGIFFIYQHHTHQHFHIAEDQLKNLKPHDRLIWSLAGMMFFSPCLEIEAFFIAAGQLGWWALALIAATYGILTILGMVVWMTIALHSIQKYDWHKIEHNAGLITGAILILVGIAGLVWHH